MSHTELKNPKISADLFYLVFCTDEHAWMGIYYYVNVREGFRDQISLQIAVQIGWIVFT